MRWWILGAVLAGLAAAIAAGGFAGAEGEPLELGIMTAPPPADAPAALSLQLSANGSCTAGTETDIHWRAAGGSPPYEVEIAGVRAAGAEGTARLECGALPRGWRGPQFGYLPRTIRGTATDAAGATAGAETILLTGPPLAAPAPRVEPPRASRGIFWVSFSVPAYETGDPAWFAALRWREVGETAWSYNAGGEPASSRGSTSTGWGLADATRFEAQVALGRSSAELERPQALDWSESVRTTTASDPTGLVAESTHDSISLSWGPQVEGLQFIATARPSPPVPPRQTVIFDTDGSRGHPVESGPPYGFTWTGLCPDTRYFISVRSKAAPTDAGFGGLVGLAVATEPAPEPRADGPLVEVEAATDRITLRWAEDVCVLHPDYHVSVREYGGGFELRDGSGSWRSFKRSDETHEIDSLRPGATYEIVLSPLYGLHPSDIHLVVETPEREYEALSDAEPPEFTVVHGKWREGGQSSTGFRIYSRGPESAAELEWHVDGRRVRRLLQPHAPAYVRGLPHGWYEFRMRGLRGSEGPTRWSEPVRAATAPIAPEITSTRYQGEHMIVAWDEPEDGIPIDRYIVEWRRTDLGEWREFEVETGGWAAITRPPFNRSGVVFVRLTAVSDEYGAGYPSADRPVRSSLRHPQIRLGFDARGCGPDGSGTFDVAWLITHGVPPFQLRLRPINSPLEAPETVVIWGNDRKGRRQFQCADAARRVDGDWEVAVEFRLTNYQARLGVASGIRSEWFGATSWPDDRSRRPPEQQSGLPRGEMPAPDTATRSVHATHVKWEFGAAHDSDGQRWVVRMRTAADAEWVERELIYGRSRANWWYVDDLEPGTRYEYAFGRYFAGGSEWSQTGVVTTLEDVAGIAVSEADGAIIVEWDSQPDAWKYLVRLRGQGRSWWAIRDATGAARERIEFRAVGHGPYTAEVMTPPRYASGEDISTFQLWPLT